MTYKRRWKQDLAHWSKIAAQCEKTTGEGWTVHTIVPTTGVENPKTGAHGDGAIIVAFKDEPDISGGVPR